MIMGFYFKHNAETISYIHKPRIFLAGLDKHFFPFPRQRFQPENGVFITAMLTPHGTESTELGKIRRPAEFLTNQIKFLSGKPELLGCFYGNFHVLWESANLRRTR